MLLSFDIVGFIGKWLLERVFSIVGFSRLVWIVVRVVVIVFIIFGCLDDGVFLVGIKLNVFFDVFCNFLLLGFCVYIFGLYVLL